MKGEDTLDDEVDYFAVFKAAMAYLTTDRYVNDALFDAMKSMFGIWLQGDFKEVDGFIFTNFRTKVINHGVNIISYKTAKSNQYKAMVDTLKLVERPLQTQKAATTVVGVYGIKTIDREIYDLIGIDNIYPDFRLKTSTSSLITTV